MPLWLALPALLGFTVAGLGLERAAGVVRPLEDRSALAWLTRGALGAALFAVAAVHPLAAALVGLALALHVRTLRVAPGVAAPEREKTPWTALAVVLALTLVALARPPVPLASGEQAWLALARVAGAGPWALTARALAPGADLASSASSIGAPALQAALALFGSDLGSLTAGAAALALVSVLAFALTLTGARGVSRPIAASVLALSPLVWVHVRSGLCELPLGLLSAALALSLLGAARGDRRHLYLAPALACTVAATDDMGAVHVCAIALGVALLAPAGPAERALLRRTAAVSASIAVVVVAVWRARLAMAGSDADSAPAVSSFAFDLVPALSLELARALADVSSFGATTALVLAATVSSLARRGPSLARALALSLLLVAIASFLGLVLGPAEPRALALEGGLFSRLVVQLLPLGALVVGAAISERDLRGSPAAGRGGTAAGRGGTADERGGTVLGS